MGCSCEARPPNGAAPQTRGTLLAASFGCQRLVLCAHRSTLFHSSRLGFGTYDVPP
jgi:hypothetical protein